MLKPFTRIRSLFTKTVRSITCTMNRSRVHMSRDCSRLILDCSIETIDPQPLSWLDIVDSWHNIFDNQLPWHFMKAPPVTTDWWLQTVDTWVETINSWVSTVGIQKETSESGIFITRDLFEGNHPCVKIVDTGHESSNGWLEPQFGWVFVRVAPSTVRLAWSLTRFRTIDIVSSS